MGINLVEAHCGDRQQALPFARADMHVGRFDQGRDYLVKSKSSKHGADLIGTSTFILHMHRPLEHDAHGS